MRGLRRVKWRGTAQVRDLKLQSPNPNPLTHDTGSGISMRVRNAIRRSVMTIPFDLFIAACIVLNIVRWM